MRRHGPPSEIRRLAGAHRPPARRAWQRMHWWIATMALLYRLSGITIVQIRRSGGDPALGAPGRGRRPRCRSTDRACSSPSRGRWTRWCGCRSSMCRRCRCALSPAMSDDERRRR